MYRRANAIRVGAKLVWCDLGLYTDVVLAKVRELVEQLITLKFELPAGSEMRVDWSGYLQFILRNALPVALQGRRGPQRDQCFVSSHYEGAWVKKEDGKGKQSTFLLQGWPFRLDAGQYSLANMALVATLAHNLGAKSILEAGCGSGRNLELLIGHNLAEVLFGLELTRSGTRASLQRFKSLSMSTSSPRIIQGTALALPFSDNAFDLVFTHHVVEQLKLYQQVVIGELARVTRHVLLCVEPFGKLQNWMQRKWLCYKGYFDGSVDDFRHGHLRPLALLALPIQKIKFRTGLLICLKE